LDKRRAGFYSESMKLIAAFLVFGVKFATKVLYNLKINWITPQEEIKWTELRLVICLNHTSLFEFLFTAAIPNRNLWNAIDRLVLPVADVTMNRPLAGWFFKTLIPNAVPITRKRDDSWTQYVEKAAGNSLMVIFPEGRMMRKDGLDKHGKPMSVKGGVADILEKLDSGKMLIAYSGGLHHVQAPGEKLPRIFKTIDVAFEQLNIADYKKQLNGSDFRSAVIADLEERKKKYC
jgi:1-acyl-sn-glycerol-3-phosphate acyltransferase